MVSLLFCLASRNTQFMNLFQWIHILIILTHELFTPDCEGFKSYHPGDALRGSRWGIVLHSGQVSVLLQPLPTDTWY